MKNLLVLLTLAFYLVSCGNTAKNNAETGTEDSPTENTEHDHSDHDHGDHDHSDHDHGDESELAVLNEDGFYGETFELSNLMSLDNAIEALGENDSMDVKLAAEVSAVCQVKGCWMTINSSDSQEVRVKFKDYGFFVPMDCNGKMAQISGMLKREVETVAEQKHYLEDGEADQATIDAVTEDKVRLSFMATGVKLANE